MTKRTDSSLRRAISVLEGLLVDAPKLEPILNSCCFQLATLFDAPFAFVYACQDAIPDDRSNTPREVQIPWEFVSSYKYNENLKTFEEYANYSTSSVVPLSLKHKLGSRQCIKGKNISELGSAFPHYHPTIEDWLAVPIVDTNRIYGIIFLCNAPSLLDQDIDTRLRPFIASANCLLRRTEKIKQFQTKTSDSNNLFKQELLSGLLDTMRNSVIVVNDDGIITLCNQAASSLFAHPKREIVGSKIADLLTDVDQISKKSFKSSLTNMIDEDSSSMNKVSIVKSNGQTALVDISEFKLHEGDKVLKGLVLDSVPTQTRLTEEYHSNWQHFQVLTNLASIAILQFDQDWQCIYANETWCELSKMTADESKGTGWKKSLHLHEADSMFSALQRDLTIRGKYTGEFRLMSPVGKTTWVNANACRLYSDGGITTGSILTLRDMTKERTAAQNLKDIVEKDQLTGLVNRAFFNDRIKQALRGINRTGPFALMFVDLDEFKHVNDTLGHSTGDTLLRKVAERLSSTLRVNDTIARISGDEFTVILNNVHEHQGVMAIADKLTLALAEPFYFDERSISVTCCIGITIANDKNSNPTELLKQADIALTKAKSAGRNQYKFYTAELDYETKLHVCIRNSLKTPRDNFFKVVYQPQVNAATMEVVGAEALARWRHPDLDTISPKVFIPLIEDSGLMAKFAAWLLDEVLQSIADWRNHGADFASVKISINLSAKQFKDTDLSAYITNKFLHYSVDPKWVVLELTETAIVEDPVQASKTLRQLKNNGFSIALDDFGTGYSSLVHLRKMPLETVKIDRSFVKDVIHDSEDGKIVNAIIMLTKKLDLKLVAEGVDNTDVKNWLMKNGCLIHQGYYYYKPLENQLMERLLVQNRRSNIFTLDH
ncbi:sensor domain-containing protein [Agaribacter flavus]|uniref:EAL domain-containing protein n=1 Tax=Agaribacter flavus TaxID=1902781 RepID=A0ABV7FRC3_9ALTE